jgi:hypothetical protein
MLATTPADLSALTPDELTRSLASLLGDERALLVAFLRHLVELERRRLHLDLGYPSVFSYLRDHLRLAKASANRRMTAARLLAHVPEVAPRLADGRLCLTTLCLLKDVLSDANAADLLDRASGQTEEQVEVLVASLRPKPAPPDLIRAVPVRPSPPPVPPSPLLLPIDRPEATPPGARVAGSGAELTFREVSLPALAPSDAPPARALPDSRVTPIDETLRVVRMTVGQDFMAELEEVKAALSHRLPPGASLEQTLRACFRVVLDVTARRRQGAPAKRPSPGASMTGARDESRGETPGAREAASAPAAPAPRAGGSPATEPTAGDPPAPSDCRDTSRVRSRYIPVTVRRAVWERDGGRCAFIGAGGHRCGSRERLEIHHRVPFAVGGEATVDGCCLLCKAHNLHQARRDFGDDLMDRFSRPRGSVPHLPVPQTLPLQAPPP